MLQENEPTVFIVDDDEAVRNSTKKLTETIRIRSQTFQKGTDFLNAYDPSMSGCLVMDVRMPEMSGLKVFEALRERHYHIPTIFVTAYNDIRSAVRAIKMGALDYLIKPAGDQELLDRIQEGILQDASIRKEQARLRHRQQQFSSLSSREQQVLRGLLDEKNNKLIALDLCISPKTVEFHRTNILKKMDAGSWPELAKDMVVLKKDLYEKPRFSFL